MLLWRNGAPTVLLTWLRAQAPPCTFQFRKEPGQVVQLLRNEKWGSLYRNVGIPQTQLSKIISFRTETNPEVGREENIEKVQVELSSTWLLGPAVLLHPFHSLFLKLTQKCVEKGENGR